MSRSTTSRTAEFLKEHPRMMGALFTLAVLLTQVQPVLADCNSHSCTGP
jgi:hypothetical protein